LTTDTADVSRRTRTIVVFILSFIMALLLIPVIDNVVNGSSEPTKGIPVPTEGPGAQTCVDEDTCSSSMVCDENGKCTMNGVPLEEIPEQEGR
jgi:hypothetical protein